MNKFSILVIIIGIVVIGIIAAVGIGSDSPISEISDSPSEVTVTVDESGAKHFSATMTEEIGVSDKRQP